ncbi:MAG: nicotinate-nucleotide adenylyltransferase [Pseudohongiellaceae bacterium]|jgi:nicotinate-nucleotide adenylyltransferase
MSLRLGVYGGMFDPPHLGHVAAAKYAAQQLKLDSVKLIPCKIPNHRAPTQASKEHRVNMLNLAIQASPELSIDTLELTREGVSYMVDTLKILRAGNPGAIMVLVLGVDSFNSLPTWHRFQEILALCSLFVLSRGGETLSQETEKKLAPYGVEVDNERQLMAKPCGGYFFDQDFANDASSSLVRQEKLLNKNLAGLLSPEVLQYIENNHLYQEISLIHGRCTG